MTTYNNSFDSLAADIVTLQAYRTLVHSSNADANLVTTTAETVFSGASVTYTIPANTSAVGDFYQVQAWGTAFTSNCTLRARVGSVVGTTLGSVVVTAGAAGAFTSWFRVGAIGAAGSFTFSSVGGSAGSAAPLNLTADLDIVLTYEFAASNAGNISTGLLILTKLSL